MRSGSLIVIDDVEKEAEATADQIRYRHRPARGVECRIPFGTAEGMAASILHEFPMLDAAIVDFRLNGAAAVRYDGIDLLQALKATRPSIVGVILTKRPIIEDEPRIKQDSHIYDLLWDKRELASQFPRYMQDLEGYIARRLQDGLDPSPASFTFVSDFSEDQTENQEQVKLLKRYHELVDKEMINGISAVEQQELDAIEARLDEMDNNDPRLQQVEAQMDAKRRSLDEELEKINRQLRMLLEQM